MSTLPQALDAHLSMGATSLCRAWQIMRQDGMRYGFTDHDQDLVINGQSFLAASGLDGTAFAHSSGLSVNNAEIIGALSAADLRDEEIEAGLFDEAEITFWLVNWADPAQHHMIYRGFLGEIRRHGARFEAELLSLSDALNRPAGRAYIKRCDCTLGDARCQIVLSDPAYQMRATLEHLPQSTRLEMQSPSPKPEGWFTGGTIRLTTASGTHSRSILKDALDSTPPTLLIDAPFDTPLAPGAEFELTAGCDYRLETCREKFSNTLNFRGFPHIPGEDRALSYPKRGG